MIRPARGTLRRNCWRTRPNSTLFIRERGLGGQFPRRVPGGRRLRVARRWVQVGPERWPRGFLEDADLVREKYPRRPNQEVLSSTRRWRSSAVVARASKGINMRSPHSRLSRHVPRLPDVRLTRGGPHSRSRSNRCPNLEYPRRVRFSIRYWRDYQRGIAPR
jgi:hypothetical protein